MRSTIIFIISAVVFFACEEPFQLDVNQAQPKVVIEGLVTNLPGKQSIKISRSGDFYGTGATPRITNAIVTVSDNLGNIINFVHNPRNHRDSAGYYVPQNAFVGVIGRTYRLKVEAEGKVYEAEEPLLPVIPMDSLEYRIDEEEREDPDDPGKFYEVLMFATEPQDEKNFYLFEFYRNDTLSRLNETDIYYSDDELLSGKVDGIPAPIFYGLNDRVRIQVYSLSRVGYVYYNDLSSLLTSDGGMFGPIPASPRTNLTNDALGFFQVSAVSIAETVIE